MGKEELKEVKKKRISSEEVVVSDYAEKLNDMQTGKSKFFYFCLIILNICTLLLAFIWLNNTKDINCFELLVQIWDNKIFLIMIALFVLNGLLYTLPNFLKLYHKQKQRKFGTLYKAQCIEKYYECVTVKGKGSSIVSSDYLMKKGINKTNALSLTNGTQVISRLSIACMALIMLVIGAFSWIEKINVLLYLLAFIAVFIDIVYVVFLIIFAKNKKKGLGILARICKILYNFKLIKDYEKAYNKMVDYSSINSSVFKQNIAILITEIASHLLIYVLRIVILFLGLYAISAKTVDRLWQLTFAFVVIDMIVSLLPLQKGTLVTEFLFIVLFTFVFSEVYVFFGLLIYKIFEYFMPVIMFAIIWLIDKITDCIVSKNKSKKEEKISTEIK